jgi:hypothetical protein
MDSEHAAMKFTVLSSIMYLVSCDAMPSGCLEDAWYTFGKPELKRWVELHMEPYHLVAGLRRVRTNHTIIAMRMKMGQVNNVVTKFG